MVGLIEDELDALFFNELLGPLAFVDLAVVEEHIPSSSCSSESLSHHELQLSKELYEGVLGGGLQGLGQKDLPEDGINCSNAGHTPPIPVLLLHSDLLVLELPDPGVMTLRAERALVYKDQDVPMLEDPLDPVPDPHHVLEVLATLIF